MVGYTDGLSTCAEIMRLLATLRCSEDFSYDSAYYPNLQGYFYDLLEDTTFSYLHDFDGYKFFCYSNVFPPNDGQAGDTRHLIFSSPRQALVETVEKRFAEEFEVGDMAFETENLKTFEPELNGAGNLITGTPVITRIPGSRTGEYGIDNPKDYESLFWRPKYPVEAFINQIESNLEKKYRQFYEADPPSPPYFSSFQLQKSISVPIDLHGEEVVMIGSLWTLGYEITSQDEKKLVELALEGGLGELNSLGFGFLNPENA